jgi:hypothetical protein
MWLGTYQEVDVHLWWICVDVEISGFLIAIAGAQEHH